MPLVMMAILVKEVHRDNEVIQGNEENKDPQVNRRLFLEQKEYKDPKVGKTSSNVTFNSFQNDALKFLKIYWVTHEIFLLWVKSWVAGHHSHVSAYIPLRRKISSFL